MGFLGGKTQTDIGGMDDLYLDGMCLSFRILCNLNRILGIGSSGNQRRGRTARTQGQQEEKEQEA